MYGLTRWNWLRKLDVQNQRMSTLLDRNRTSGADQEALTSAGWLPLVDVSEDEEEYLIGAELPEVAKEDVYVHTDDGVLTIEGERRLERKEKGRRYHRIERAHGRFARRFPGRTGPGTPTGGAVR